MHSDNPIAQVEQANRRYLEAYLANKELLIVWERVATLDEEVEKLLYEEFSRSVRRVEMAIGRMQAAGQADPDIIPHFAAHALLGMVSRFAYTWVLRNEPFELDEVSEPLSKLWVNALGLTRSSETRADDQARRPKRSTG